MKLILKLLDDIGSAVAFVIFVLSFERLSLRGLKTRNTLKCVYK